MIGSRLDEHKTRLMGALLAEKPFVTAVQSTVGQRQVDVYYEWGFGSLSFMPGNARVLISHGVYVVDHHRGQGFGLRYAQIREKCAREAGATLLLATVRNDNAPERSLLRKLGWKIFQGNDTYECCLWGKVLL